MIQSCRNSTPEQSEVVDHQQLVTHARETVALTFRTLSSELKAALSTGGIPNAIGYCNLNAMKLTDSLSIARNTTIKRATDRWRNPQNKANTQETEIIQFYQSALKKDSPISDTLIVMGDHKAYYAPIRLNQLCLNCHGNKNDIAAYDFIKKHYPDDQAINYKLGELRGIWSVSYYER